MKYDWNTSKATPANSRISVNDGVTTCHLTEGQLPEDFSLRDLAESYASTYDHNGTDETYAICEIEDLSDGESHRFAFDGKGNFEWNSSRQS